MSHASGITKRADKSWKTILHEHYDFFLAPQHPSASQALTVLKAVSSTPARMWRHEIHTFLKVLAHACPDVAPRPRIHEHGESAISSLADDTRANKALDALQGLAPRNAHVSRDSENDQSQAFIAVQNHLLDEHRDFFLAS